ncbi:MAG: tRNA (adenosine(37)-N6)-threonylcarbamoyltransferase complex dimerization subunit type 1 TsaB [Treponema sp.]|jgi:tRNA threonylcarbamoyladenosine biosynthesis protein TsaB|nr:tRNA (adenosine(37)-N6)-threonylcarbamoyltransferase complex dimerization subunit type 1 TsaB [Treponema sp.]
MNILALDTATPVCSIALSSEKGNWYVEIDAGQRHSELFMDATDMLMNLGGLQPEDLDIVACMKGPGSFTGLRVGFAAAKGICLALAIPLLTVPTLDCMAVPGYNFPGLVIPVIDAKQHCFFIALYRGTERITPYLDADPQKIVQYLVQYASETDRILLTGLDGEMLYSALSRLLEPALKEKIHLDPGRRKGRAQELIALVKPRLANLQDTDSEVSSCPLYLRKSDAELNVIRLKTLPPTA